MSDGMGGKGAAGAPLSAVHHFKLGFFMVEQDYIVMMNVNHH